MVESCAKYRLSILDSRNKWMGFGTPQEDPEAMYDSKIMNDELGDPGRLQQWSRVLTETFRHCQRELKVLEDELKEKV